jgi:sn-glycerol 3-phosphate transport system substrate-binding protein
MTSTTRRSVLAGAALAASFAVAPAFAQAPTEIELFFPVPVDGQLARDMTALTKEFNEKNPAIKATPVYTGSYDETLIKTRAAMKAGKRRPP